MSRHEYLNNLSILALTVNTVALNNDYMSFQEGVIIQGAIGTGLGLAGAGASKVKDIFSKDKSAKIRNLRKKVEIRQLKGTNPAQTLKNAWRYETIQGYERKLPPEKKFDLREYNGLSDNKRLKYKKNVFKSAYYDEARRLLKEAKGLRGKEQAKKLKEFEKAFAKAKLEAYKAKFNGNLKPAKFTGKLSNGVKTVTGVRAGNTALKILSANSSKIRAASKFVKGNAAFSLISVAADYDKFVLTKEKVGTKAMQKEILKSTGVAVAESVGFMAGMKAGAALGTAIGTVVPGVGNVVGCVAGAIIGGLLSWGIGKAAHSMMGKSELQKYDEEQAELAALKAEHNQQSAANLISRAAQKIENDTLVLNSAGSSPEIDAQLAELDALKADYELVLGEFLEKNPEVRAEYERLLLEQEQDQE